MTLAERLRQLLDSRGLSVAKLAKATAIPASTIDSWLYPLKARGCTTEPPLARLQLVADVLCCEVERPSRLSALFEGVEAGTPTLPTSGAERPATAPTP